MRASTRGFLIAASVLTFAAVWRVVPACAEECQLSMSAGLYGVESGKEISFHGVWVNENQPQGAAMRLFVRREPETPWMSDVQSFFALQGGTAVNVAFAKKYVTAPTAPHGMELCFTLVKIPPGGGKIACGQKKCTKINNIHEEMQVDKDTSAQKAKALVEKQKGQTLAFPDLVVQAAGWDSRSLRVTNKGVIASKSPCKLVVEGKTAQNQGQTKEFDVPPLAPGEFKDFDVTSLMFLRGSLTAWVDGRHVVTESNENNNEFHAD